MGNTHRVHKTKKHEDEGMDKVSGGIRAMQQNDKNKCAFYDLADDIDDFEKNNPELAAQCRQMLNT